MKIIDLFVWLVSNICKSDFFIIIFGLLCTISVFGLVTKRLS